MPPAWLSLSQHPNVTGDFCAPGGRGHARSQAATWWPQASLCLHLPPLFFFSTSSGKNPFFSQAVGTEAPGLLPAGRPVGQGSGCPAFLYRRKDLMVLLQEMRYSLGPSREVAGHTLVVKIINQFSSQRHQGKGLPFLCRCDSEAYLLWQTEPAIKKIKIILSPR